MVGLVIVVAILIIGIVLYTTFSAETSGSRSAASRAQGSTDLVVALAATHIPACDVQFWEAAQACIENDRAIGACGDPCDELQLAVDAVAGSALSGYKYNLSLSGTAVQNESGCPSASPQLYGVSESTTQIQFGNGRYRNLTLALCR